MRRLQRGRAPARLSESLAAWWLRAHGHSIVARNVRVAGVEVDLLARKGAWTLVVEVKARRLRRGQPPAGPEELVSQAQLRRLQRVLRALDRRGRLVRLDLIGVSWRGPWPRLRRWTGLGARSEVE